MLSKSESNQLIMAEDGTEFVDTVHSDDGSYECSIPSITERLGQLRPSKELLDYYRRKIAEFDQEHDEMKSKLDAYKCTYEEQHKMEWEQRQKEDEICELQKGLSDMQVFLFQERENVLRLYAENDRLKIQELEDRKKIQHLLSLTHSTDTEITYFIKDHPSNIVQACKEKKSKKKTTRPESPVIGHRERLKYNDFNRQQTNKSDVNKQKQKGALSTKDQDTLLLQIESLQAQLEEQTKISKEQINALLEDRKVAQDEQQIQRERDTAKIKSLSDKLEKTQALLYESTKDFLEQKYETRLKERKWMSERDKIMQEMDYLKEQVDINREEWERQLPRHVNAGTQMIGSPGNTSPPIRATNIMIIKQLRTNLEQTQNMAEMYREQLIGLEDELARIREENDVGKDVFKDKTEKLTQRLKLMNQRYASLEKRRGLEVEGFKNDIKILRSRLKEVEKQLFKVTVNIGEQFDWEILHNTHRTAQRSKKIAGELHGLKSKVYEMEKELRNL